MPIAGLALLAGSAFSAAALPLPSAPFSPPAELVPVANGCGPGRYRGPYGSCHKFGTGPYPQGYFGPYYN